MARASEADRLRHILEEADAVAGYVAGRSEADFLRERLLRDAIERCLERISEASRHVSEATKAKRPEIPRREVATIGNVLRHGYDGVRPTEIWRIATHDLPPLRVAILALLSEAEAG
jgi:uncharacterized protein with HEPN domain